MQLYLILYIKVTIQKMMCGLSFIFCASQKYIPHMHAVMLHRLVLDSVEKSAFKSIYLANEKQQRTENFKSTSLHITSYIPVSKLQRKFL